MSINKPSVVYLYGRNFMPTREQSFQLCAAAFKLYPKDLSADHLDGVIINRANIEGVSRHDFFEIVPRTQAENPDARIIDLLLPNDETQQDFVILFVWHANSSRKWWQFWK